MRKDFKPALDHPHGYERHRFSMLAIIKQMTSLVIERLHITRPNPWIEIGCLSGRDSVDIYHKSTLIDDEDGNASEIPREVKFYGSDRLDDSIRLQLHLHLEATAELLQQAGVGYVVDACLSGKVGRSDNVDVGSDSSTSATVRSAKIVVDQSVNCWV